MINLRRHRIKGINSGKMEKFLKGSFNLSFEQNADFSAADM